MAELTQLQSGKSAGSQNGQSTSGEKRINVTRKAVEKIRAAFAREGVSGGLRLGVLGGGCSGLSYQFKFAPAPRPRDHVFEFDDVKVFVDPKSMLFLDGMTLDWQDSLMQSGFVFQNPHATKSCGCGTSFSS
ncbi:MAG: iron-sulfur cluster assembly accessory protein [Acidobacteriaceae bacterium]|nr:iron-sulfur cluster assembly accessory protein [Acidobacteriaceae bacterium]MBV9501081.1 iron-sulfur cluster assembly accessory protein [Acidobacteriaceae bacterium]